MLFQNWHEKFDEFWPEHLTVSKIFILMYSFWAKHILLKLKKYRAVIFHETEEGYKIRRVIDLSFQNWHKEFDKFWPQHTKVSNICDILISELRVTSYKLIALRVELIARVKSYELFLLHELLVTFSIRVTSYFLLHELRVTFYIRVTSYCLLPELRVIIIARVTSYCLFHKLRVTVYCTSCELLFACELRFNFYMRFASYFLTMSYKMIKLFMIITLW